MNCGDLKIIEETKKILENYPREKDRLIGILNDVQERFGYIPKENIFQFIQRDFPDEKYIVIGDRESDFRVGTANGLKTVGCAYGFGNERELSICNKVIYSPKELLGIIKML